MQVGEIVSVESVPRPAFAKPSRSRDTALRAGLAYEKKLEKWLKATLAWEIISHPWFHVEDEAGLHYRSPDFIIKTKTQALVLEAKLTQCLRGDAQLREYQPIVQAWTGLPTLMIQVFKHASFRPTGRHFLTLPEAITHNDYSNIHTFQWRP